MDTKKLTTEALKAAAKEAATYKSAVVAYDTQDSCAGKNDIEGHNNAVVKQHIARQALDAKIDGFLKAHGVDTKEARTQHDDTSGLKLKNDIIEKVEQAGHKDAHKKLHPTKGDEETTCPATPNQKGAVAKAGRGS